MNRFLIIVTLIVTTLFITSCAFVPQEFSPEEIIGGEQCWLQDQSVKAGTFDGSVPGYDKYQAFAELNCDTIQGSSLITFRTSEYQLEDYGTGDWVAVLPEGEGVSSLIAYKYNNADNFVTSWAGYNTLSTTFGDLYYKVEGNKLYLESGVVIEDVPYTYSGGCRERKLVGSSFHWFSVPCQGTRDEFYVYEFDAVIDPTIPIIITPTPGYEGREVRSGGYSCKSPIVVNGVAVHELTYASNQPGIVQSAMFELEGDDKVVFDGDIYWYGYGCGDCLQDSHCPPGQACVAGQCKEPTDVTFEHDDIFKQGETLKMTVSATGSDRSDITITVAVKENPMLPESISSSGLPQPLGSLGRKTFSFPGLDEQGSYSFVIFVFDGGELTDTIASGFQVDPSIIGTFRPDFPDYFRMDKFTSDFEITDTDFEPFSIGSAPDVTATLNGQPINVFVTTKRPFSDFRIETEELQQAGQLLVTAKVTPSSGAEEQEYYYSTRVGEPELVTTIVQRPEGIDVTTGVNRVVFQTTDKKGNLLSADLFDITITDFNLNEYKVTNVNTIDSGIYYFDFNFDKPKLWNIEILPQKITPFVYASNGADFSFEISGTIITDYCGDGVCNRGESLSTCFVDCSSTIPDPSPVPGGDTGAGSVSTVTIIVIVGIIAAIGLIILVAVRKRR